jgi:murein DD-endopeptidase MepM/ murein hydrolase activator NlpD
MSYRSGHYEHRRDSGRPVEGWAYEYPRTPHPHGQQGQQIQPQHAQPQHAQAPHHARRRFRAGDYTLVHAGHQVRLGPVAFWVVVGTLVIMAGWSVATGTYFAFHDDVLKRLIARQAEMQFAYEDRIAELRAQVDRITSRQLLDQEQFEAKLDQLLNRQATLESRASTLTGVADPATTGSIKHPARATPEPARSGPLKPSPINDTVIFTAPPDREARLESRPLPADARHAARRMKGGIEGALMRLSDSLDRVASRQLSSLNALEENYDSKARRMRSVLADLGVDPGKAPPPPQLTTGSIGGPFVPAAKDANAFERQIYRINAARAQVDRLNRTLTSVPVRKPIFGEIDMSSPFGMRMDPFMKGPAIHTGVDMRGDTGDPVRATAAGTVTIAGWNGGYGKMVEIDHGNGLATRYGHMSAIDVTVGQNIKIGQIVGKIGSTGRSTGPHLHYETRVSGEAVDPQKFLRAGLRLGNIN